MLQNFEKFGSAPHPPPHKTPVTKLKIPTKNVKNEIQKAENKITIADETLPKPLPVETRQKPRLSKVTPLEVRKSEENLVDEKFSNKVSSETITLKLKNAESILGISIIGGTDENSDITVSLSVMSVINCLKNSIFFYALLQNLFESYFL